MQLLFRALALQVHVAKDNSIVGDVKISSYSRVITKQFIVHDLDKYLDKQLTT